MPLRRLTPDRQDWVLERTRLTASAQLIVDVLVLGAGMAGLRAAVRARELGGSVALAYEGRGASPFIIGCNAPFAHADSADSQQQYAQDISAGGYGLSDPALVDVLTRGATEGVQRLATLGVPIAREGERFRQRQLSGNWYPRSVYHPGGLGAQALPVLSAHAGRAGVQMLAAHRAVRLLQQDGRVVGALLFEPRTRAWKPVLAGAVVIALGGLGRLYEDSTYPGDVTGAAYSLGYEVGAPLVDMEFVQFEPLCTFTPESLRGLELPTSMLVEGAQLLNSAGERFMFRQNPQWGEGRVEKARLSLCIQQEIDEGRSVDGGVIYDATRVPADVIEGYVRHCRRLRNAGLDPLNLRVPIRPAAHSLMGGLWIDAGAATPVRGLFAAGEAAGGLHGASRIAGNGGADALVFGDVAGASAARAASEVRPARVRDALQQAFEAIAGVGHPQGTWQAKDAQAGIRRALTAGAGLYRTEAGLRDAIAELDVIALRVSRGCAVSSDAERVEAFSTLGMAQVARAVAAAALTRAESRGAHQRRDFPQTDPGWLRHVVVHQSQGGTMDVSTTDLRQ